MSDLFSKISEILSDPEASRKIRQIADSISSNSSVPPEEESQPDFSPAEDASAEPLLPALTESLGSLGTVSSGPHSRDLQLLQAMRPYLRSSRAEKIDSAMKAIRMIDLLSALR